MVIKNNFKEIVVTIIIVTASFFGTIESSPSSLTGYPLRDNSSTPVERLINLSPGADETNPTQPAVAIEKNRIDGISDEELEFFEGIGQVQLAKNVDALSVNPSYPGRSQNSGPGRSQDSGPNRSQNSGMTSGTSKLPPSQSGSSRMPPKIVGNPGNPGGNDGNGPGNPSDDFNPGIDLYQDKLNLQQCPEHYPYTTKKKPFRGKVTFIGAGFEAEINYDKNQNPIYTATTEDGSKGIVTYDQCVDKYHHYDVYGLTPPKGFDRNKRFKPEYKNNPEKWREYVKKTVPPDKIMEFQRANVKSFATEKFQPIPGFVGARKDPGTLYINKKTGQIHFVNDRTNIWRTTVKYNI